MLKNLRLFLVTSLLALAAIIEYIRSVCFFSSGGNYRECPCFKNDHHAKVHTYSLGTLLHSWDHEHHGKTLSKALREELGGLLAFPGTVVPVSWWLSSKLMFWMFVLVVYPVYCFLVACNEKRLRKLAEIPAYFQQNLLNPTHWLALWWMNCVCMKCIVPEGSKAIEMLNVHAMLSAAEESHFPTIKCIEGDVVVKNANVEGGMGIHFFKTQAVGGPCVIQYAPELHSSLKDLLPVECQSPPPRFHVITLAPVGNDQDQPTKAVSCVLEASVENGKPVFFDVALDRLVIGKASTKDHWFSAYSLSSFWKRHQQHSAHIEVANTKGIEGSSLALIEKIATLAENAHRELVAQLPCAVWEIQLAVEGPIIGNLSAHTPFWSDITPMQALFHHYNSYLQYNNFLEIREDAQ